MLGLVLPTVPPNPSSASHAGCGSPTPPLTDRRSPFAPGASPARPRRPEYRIGRAECSPKKILENVVTYNLMMCSALTAPFALTFSAKQRILLEGINAVSLRVYGLIGSLVGPHDGPNREPNQ